MLTIKTNKNNCKLTYIPLGVTSISTGETVYDDITIETDNSHNLKENDEVAFIRQDGESISYFKNAGVKNVVDKNTFTIDGFGKYIVNVNGYEQTFIKYSNNIHEIDYNSRIYTTNSSFQTIEINGSIIDINKILKTYTGITFSSITGVFISSEVVSITNNGFSDLENLSTIDVAINNRVYTSENNVLFNKNKTKLICYPGQKTGTNYRIPSTVEKINDKAFKGAVNLTNVTIPSFVQNIGDGCFSSCSNLNYVTCKPINPPVITDTSFNNETLSAIYVKEGQGNRYGTAWKKLKSKISENSSIIDDTKVNQDNTRLYLSDSTIVEITGSTLDSGISETYADSLVSVEIGIGVTSIDNYTFSGCALLTSVTIPDTVKTIGDYSFYNCANTNFNTIVIPDSVTSIGKYAFDNCGYLRNIYIGKGVDRIGDGAFTSVHNSTNIYCEPYNPPILGNSNVFLTTTTFYVPTESINKYKGVYMLPTSLTSITGALSQKYVCLNTDEHIFVTNKDEVDIRRRYLWDENSHKYVYNGAITMCDGDYYIFDNLFLIQNEDNTDAILKNIKLDITASTVSYEPILLRDCLIGVTNDGKDDRYHIYIPYSNANIEFIDELEDILKVTTFTTDDIRFLYNGSNTMKYGNTLQQGSYADKVCGNIEVDFNIGDNFEVNLHHDEQITNYIEKVKNDSINKIIDYERHEYVPMYYSESIPNTEDSHNISADEYLNAHSNEIDGKLKKVNKIKFILYFRTKDFTLYDADGNEIDKETGNTDATDYVDFGTWQTDDNGYWNNYKIRSDNQVLEEVYNGYNIKGDLLGYLGFTDDDVYYQKDAFKKSFLRLSFYDSPNRETQKLLYYSTIYFDTNVYSAKYINDLNAWREDSGYIPEYNQLVFAYDIESEFNSKKTSLLTAQMSCTDKYDNSSSSDGFYLHLFDKLVSGNTCTPIYMKAEFNNAKFGKVVPMIRPIFGNTNVPIDPTAPQFPREYIKGRKKSSGEIYTWTSMDMLLQDMYTKIYIKYNFETNQFVWFLPQGELNETLEFSLFEPRVKGYNFETYETLRGEDIGYGNDDGLPNWFEGEFNEDQVWVTTEDGYTESEWAERYDGCCLMTTATTLSNDNMLNGTRLFNKSVIDKIDRIWIDGMMVYGSNVYDSVSGKYKTTNFQLPDIPFTVTTEHTSGNPFIWNPKTTQEEWNDETGSWHLVPESKPKKIHSVNYYFKTNLENHVKLIDELYNGIHSNKKTKEITQDLCNQLKSVLPVSPSETLPSGMFSKILSLRCVKFVKNITINNNVYHFTTIGNGAFDNCQGLVRATVNDGAVDIISKNCFTGCRSLKEANLANTKIILREAFQGCYTLTKVIFATGGNNTIKYIGCGSFGYTKVREIYLPNSILRVGNSAFRRCYQLCVFRIDGANQALTFGKRVFADCAILKYNMSRYSSNKYDYYGGVPDIIQYLLINNNKIVFYDACRERYVSLAVSSEKDRGKTMYHYKGDKYLKYINKNRIDVLNFEDWHRYLI